MTIKDLFHEIGGNISLLSDHLSTNKSPFTDELEDDFLYNSSIFFSNISNDSSPEAPNGTTHSKFVYSTIISLLIVYTSVILASTTILANLIIVLAFYLESSLRQNPANFLIFSIVLSDLLLGVTGPVPTAAAVVKGYWPLGRSYCYIWDISNLALPLISQASTLALALDRYVGVKYPSKYRAWTSQIKMVAIVSFIWIFLFGFCIVVIIFWTTEAPEDFDPVIPQCNLRMPNELRTVIVVLIFYVRFIIMCYLYAYLYKIAAQLNRQMSEKKRQMQQAANMSGDQGMDENVASLKDDNDENRNLSNCLSEGAGYTEYQLSRLENKNFSPGRNQTCSTKCKRFLASYKKRDDEMHIKNSETKLESKKGYLDFEGAHPCVERKNIMAPVDIVHENKNSNSTPSPYLNVTQMSATCILEKPETVTILEDTFGSGALSVTDFQRSRTPSPDGCVPLHHVVAKTILYPPGDGTPPNEVKYQNTDRVTGEAKLREFIQTFDPGEDEKRTKKAFWTIVFLLATNVISYGPWVNVTILANFYTINWSPEFLYTVLYFIYLKGLINPFSYVIVNPSFKAACKRIFHGNCQKNQAVSA